MNEVALLACCFVGHETHTGHAWLCLSLSSVAALVPLLSWCGKWRGVGVICRRGQAVVTVDLEECFYRDDACRSSLAGIAISKCTSQWHQAWLPFGMIFFYQNNMKRNRVHLEHLSIHAIDGLNIMFTRIEHSVLTVIGLFTPPNISESK